MTSLLFGIKNLSNDFDSLNEIFPLYFTNSITDIRKNFTRGNSKSLISWDDLIVRCVGPVKEKYHRSLLFVSRVDGRMRSSEMYSTKK